MCSCLGMNSISKKKLGQLFGPHVSQISYEPYCVGAF